MESLKQLIYKKEIDDIIIYFEIESNPNRFDFGTYTVEVQSIKFNTFGSDEIPMNELKNACNTVLKAETLEDIKNIKQINKAINQAINYGEWSSVSTEVADILNATLDYDEIQLIAQDCVSTLNAEDLLGMLRYYAEHYNKSFTYENKQELIRFVTQIFICDWLQGLNGIRRCLGKQDFNKIYPTYDVIENWEFRNAIKQGEQCYDLTHKVEEE